MTGPSAAAGGSPGDIVSAFYRAVNERDVERIGDLIDQRFASDAVLLFPPSLPYGGRFEGVGRLRKLFTRMAASTVPAGPDKVAVVNVIEDGDQVAARLEFDWHAPGSPESVPSGAVEVWSFLDGQVREIRAFYWDTAECARLVSKVSG